MKYEKISANSIGLIIPTEKLEKLIKFFENEFDDLTISSVLSNDTKINFQSDTEILKYENYKTRFITSIMFVCEKYVSGSGEAKLMLEISDKRELENGYTVKYDLKFDDDVWGFKFESELNDILSSMKASYSRIINYNSSLLFIFTGVILLILSILVPTLEVDNTFDSEILFNLSVLSFICLLVINPVEKFKEFIFPAILIGIGEQKDEIAKRSWYRNFVFGTLLTSIIIAFLFSFN